MIRFDNVSFSYGEKQIFKDLNLEIKKGDRICLFAPSGYGKTTLLRLIMGLEKPDSGNIEGIRNKTFSVVFQEDRLIPQKNIYENIELFGGNDKITEILNNLNLSGTENLYPNELSGGMARRVAVARAINYGGDIFILDEPFNGIDTENIKQTAEYILKITENKTIITVTHSKSEAELLKSEIIML